MNDFPTPFQNGGDSNTRENQLQPIDIAQILTTPSKVEHIVPYQSSYENENFECETDTLKKKLK